MKKIILCLGLFFLVNVIAQAQEEKKVDIGLTAGYATLIKPDPMETNYGFHLAANFSKPDIIRLDSDYQISFNYVSATNEIININALIGSRLYFNRVENKNRYYLSSFFGLAYINEWGDQLNDRIFTYGYSVGLFASLNQFILGVSIENPEVFLFKAGFTF